MEAPECFVCFHTAPPLHRVCRCNTLVHPACLRALEGVPAHRTHCPVCRQPYARRASWFSKIGSCALCVSTVLAAGVIGLIGWSQYWVAFETSGSPWLILFVHVTGGVAIVATAMAWVMCITDAGASCPVPTARVGSLVLGGHGEQGV